MKKNRWKMLFLVAMLFCGCREVNTIEETNPKENSMTLESEPENVVLEETGSESEETTESRPAETEDSQAELAMTLDEILAYNRALKSNSGTHLVDLGAYPDSQSGDAVRDIISGYAIPDYPLLNGTPITEEYKAILLEKRNLAGIPAAVSIEYAITVMPAPVRSFPTEDHIGNGGFDYFQESMFLVGECVAILHRTADGSWSFVQGENYNGWVRSDCLGLTDRTAWLTWWNRTQTGDECGVAIANTSLNGIAVRMGTVLPLEAETEDAFVLAFPTRDGNGGFRQDSCVIYKNLGIFSKEYLPYNIENVMTQVQKMVGTPYGWGDTDGNPDCSSTVQAIYRCFGFRLARNTSWQAVMNGVDQGMAGRYREEIISVLQTKNPGTLLFMNGHVMMYVGMENDVPMIFHNVTNYSPDGVAQVSMMQAVITPLDICRLDGTSYYNVIHSLLDLSAQ